MDIILVKAFKAILNVKLLLFLLIACSGNLDTTCVYEAYKGKQGESIFVYKWNWGVNGNSQLIAISTAELRSKEEIDLERDYIYEGEYPIFLKTQNDSLLIYTYKKANMPSNKILANIPIEQFEIDNLTNMRLREDTSYINLERICLK